MPQGGEGGRLGRKLSVAVRSGARDPGDVAAGDAKITQLAVGKLVEFIASAVEFAPFSCPQTCLFQRRAQLLKQAGFKSADIVDKGHVGHLKDFCAAAAPFASPLLGYR